MEALGLKSPCRKPGRCRTCSQGTKDGMNDGKLHCLSKGTTKPSILIDLAMS